VHIKDILLIILYNLLNISTVSVAGHRDNHPIQASVNANRKCTTYGFLIAIASCQNNRKQ